MRTAFIVAVAPTFTTRAQAPTEADMRQYLRVSPPSVHQMVLTLDREGLIRRQPGTARSIELLVDPKCLPELL